MRIFLRTFNNKINSKTGTPLAEGQYRGTLEWLQFQDLLIECLKNLGHECLVQKEHPYVPELFSSSEFDKKIVVHKCKRDEEFDLTFMQMHFRELFTIDTNGWGADHSGNDLFKQEEVGQDEATRFCQDKSKEFLRTGTSKCDQPSETNIGMDGEFILVPVQIPRDYTIKHHSPVTVKYFIESVQAWAIETETQVCFKMHPHNASDRDLHKIVEEAQASSPFVRKITGNIHELIKRSSGVMVINSGTGFESLLHGKPVATIGDCDYRRVTFNADVRRLDEVSAFFRRYSDVERQLAYKFVYWYWKKHAYDVNDPLTPARLTEYLRSHL